MTVRSIHRLHQIASHIIPHEVVDLLLWENNSLKQLGSPSAVGALSKQAFLETPQLRNKDPIKPSSVASSRHLAPSIPGPSRRVSSTGSKVLHADWIYNSTTGSFWLPRPPPHENLVTGYHVRPSTSSFSPKEYGQSMYNNEQGFMLNHQIRIMLSQGFNAGDFLAVFIGPIISGRPVSLRGEHQGNRNSLMVVGSILGWGVRYSWGPGLMFDKKLRVAADLTEAVFATRGPRSYADFSSVAAKGSMMYKVYGDAGSLLSWFYQPHDQKKMYPLCLLPHHLDWNKRVPFLVKTHEWWNGTKPFFIDIMQPLFNIANEIVQCEFILCSSLHGIIFSDSYNVPNAHVKYKDNVMGEHYKFEDYYESVGRQHDWLDMDDESLWKSGKVIEFINKQKNKYDISGMDIYPFWESCPMHAEAYNRTREEHLEFAKMFTMEFDDLMVHRPVNFSEFHKEMSRRLGVTVDG
eukprot:CCRYP_014946-RA/>CCRYP_014946-RA protein AED:0.28 eAED:0.28 QI:43/1/1/1/0/0/2/142/462